MNTIGATREVLTLEEYRNRTLDSEDHMQLWLESMKNASISGNESSYSLDNLTQFQNSQSMEQLATALTAFNSGAGSIGGMDSIGLGTSFLGRYVSVPTSELSLTEPRDSVGLDWRAAPKSDVEITIRNAEGEVVLKQSVTTNKDGIGEFKWVSGEDDGIASGDYILSASSNGQAVPLSVQYQATAFYPGSTDQPESMLELAGYGLISLEDIDKINL